MLLRCIFFLAGLCGAASGMGYQKGEASRDADSVADLQRFITESCLDCHSGAAAEADFRLDEVLEEEVTQHADRWERVVSKLQSRQMPPLDADRPDEATYESIVAQVTDALDQHAAADPQPGRTDTFRRLTRFEYQNAVRDLLAVEVDSSQWLPVDQSSNGFDNITVSELSPLLLNRYLTAAQEISRLAVGGSENSPGGATIRVAPDKTQEQHVTGLPLGTRGGVLIPWTFPQDGEYEIHVRLARDRNEEVEGLRGEHELVLLVDKAERGSFRIRPPRDKNHAMVDAHLKKRIRVAAGPHKVGVTFVAQSRSLQEIDRQPWLAHFNRHRHPRLSPAVYQVSITGPFEPLGPGDTPSRKRIFATLPNSPDYEHAAATAIIRPLLRRAYRRPVTEADLGRPLQFFADGRANGTFDDGIELALTSILINPQFLFRIERDPVEAAAGTAYRISDFELASRLSFFLWSSIPDDQLLSLAAAARLHEPQVLRSQVHRMLADRRADALVHNFAGQWLYLRNLDSIQPDMRRFPDFDDNLRQAMRTETEMLFRSVIADDRSVLDLLRTRETWVNERLAKHYGIPHVYGSRFRKVRLDKGTPRGGLLRHGSILTVTSYATRTSPVIRGHWILKNLLGCPPPPPPDNVPALKDNTVDATLSVRERLAEHRANPACASCHDVMDPVGFALENFDAIGRWRDDEAGRPVDSSGGLADGSQFSGVQGLEQALLRRPELFVATMTERLLTYALGRGVKASDAPAIRGILRSAAESEYRFSEIIAGIVQSTPFQMRMTQ